MTATWTNLDLEVSYYRPGSISVSPNAGERYTRQEQTLGAPVRRLVDPPGTHMWQLSWRDRQEVLHRWWWIRDGYIEGYLTHEVMAHEREVLSRQADGIVAVQLWIEAGADEKAFPVADPIATHWRNRWLELHAAARHQAEIRRQKKALREGHETLKAIKRELRGPVSSPQKASRPARTSPTL